MAIKLWLTAARTLEAIWWAGHDDRWFLQKAIFILHRHWLGPYDHMTLIKGQGYPLWVAFVSSMRMPLLFAQQLLYALACLAVSCALAPSLRSSVSRLILFVVLLFNPMSFTDDTATKITREGFYPALGLLVFAGAAGTILRLDARRRDVLPWAVLSGVALALFWHTREEGVWLVPFLGFAILAVFQWVVRDSRAHWRRAVLAVALPGLIVATAHFAIILANGLQYGVFEVVEFKWEPFLRAYGSLTHVRQHPSAPRFPVPKEVRERVYAVSPAFAELRPFLEGQLGLDWRHGAGDLRGTSFMWAFREAVEKAGYYARGSAAVKEYYQRVTDEVEAARRDGRLDARPPRASLLPPILRGQRRAIFQAWLRGVIRIPTFVDFYVTRRYSEGSDSELREFAETTRTRLAPRQMEGRKMHLLGWAVHVDGPLEITVENSDGTDVPGARVIRLPSPDLYEHLKSTWKDFAPARHARFDIDVPSPEAYLVLSLHGRRIERIALGNDPPMSRDPNVRFSVDQFWIDYYEPQLSSIDAFRLGALRRIGLAYQRLCPPLFVLAVLLYLSNARWLAQRRGDWTIAILMVGLLSAIAARVLILSLIDVTSFDAFTGGYQSPEYPLLLIVGVVVGHRGIVALRSRWLAHRE